jgi:hypothetical protein
VEAPKKPKRRKSTKSVDEATKKMLDAAFRCSGTLTARDADGNVIFSVRIGDPPIPSGKPGRG